MNYVILFPIAVWLTVFSVMSPALEASTYVLDKDDTVVGFKVAHIVTYVQGTFREFDGYFAYDPERPEAWSAEAVIKAASIDTPSEKRDENLRSADFLDTEKFPEITFRSTHVSDATPEGANLHGLLSIRGVEKPVVLSVQVMGEGKNRGGKRMLGFSAHATIKRRDYGITFDQVVETGQPVVGEEVVISIEGAGVLKEIAAV